MDRTKELPWNEEGSQPAVSEADTMHIAAMGDLHCPYTDTEFLKSLFDQIDKEADVVLLCGDLTHHGAPSEATMLAEILAPLRCPILGVLGNHDFELGMAETVTHILRESGMMVLDGDVQTINGVDFIGTKGFAGGFGDYALKPWGELSFKEMVKEGQKEAAKFETALNRSNSIYRIGLLHYAPIRQTVEGEPEEIIPFLGSSMFEDVLVQHSINAVFHGHAHHGKLQGVTRNNIPVFNVAMPLLQQANPSQAPFFSYLMPLKG